MKNLFLGVTLAGMSLTAFAGNSSSGGGGAVVCRGADKKIASAQLLDLYEGAAIYGYKVMRSSQSVDEQLDAIYSFVQKVSAYEEGYRAIQKTVQKRTRVLPEGVRLEPINDALPVFHVEGCAIEQFARYTEWGDVLVDRELYTFLQAKPDGNTDLAALVVHETVYALMRAIKSSDSSKEARRIVAALFSDQRTSAPFSLYALFSDAYPTKGSLLKIRNEVPDRDQIAFFAFGATTFTNDGVKHAEEPITVSYEVNSFEPLTGKRALLAKGECVTIAIGNNSIPCETISLQGTLKDGVFLEVKGTLLNMDNWYLDLAFFGFGGVNAVELPFHVGTGSRPEATFIVKPWQK